VIRIDRTRLLPRVWSHRRKSAAQCQPWPIPLYKMWDEIAALAAEIRASDFMAEMMRRRAGQGGQGLMAALDCATLYALTRWHRPRVVVESGGFVGLAAAFILKALADAAPTDAKLYSIESDENCAHGALIPDELRRQFVPLRAKVEDIIRTDTLPRQVDMFLHDSSHRYRHMLSEFREFWPRIRAGGLLVSHDVHMNAAFAKFVAETYAHDKGTGVVDRSRTSHEEWGRWGYIGFMIKKADRANV
jgi:predicted O-methyltransferase YrrM